VRQITYEEALAELDALGEPRTLAELEENTMEQAPTVGQAMDRLETEWFNPDSQHVAHEPALPPQMSAPTPTPPPPLAPAQPPAPAMTADHVSHENAHPGNGAGQVQRVNGTSRPRPGNGAVPRPNPEALRGIRPKPRTWRDYPRTHPVHGIV
jgi:hypothetical protein